MFLHLPPVIQGECRSPKGGSTEHGPSKAAENAKPVIGRRPQADAAIAKPTDLPGLVDRHGLRCGLAMTSQRLFSNPLGLSVKERFRRCRCVHQETLWEITGRSHQRVLMPCRVGVK
jgi:hypothetical protein